MRPSSAHAHEYSAPTQPAAISWHGFSGHLRLAALASGPENDEDSFRMSAASWKETRQIGSEPVSLSVSSTMAVFTCWTASCGSNSPLTNSDRAFRFGVTTFRM